MSNAKESENTGLNPSTSASSNGFDLDAIREIIADKAESYSKTVKDTDVDWFLRESGVVLPAHNEDAPKQERSVGQNSSTTPEATAASSDEKSTRQASPQKDRESSIEPLNNHHHFLHHSSTGSPSSPIHLQTSISNTNDNNSAKTKPSVADVRHENVGCSPPNPVDSSSRRRKSSVSSIGSANSMASGSGGGFFSKLKGKLANKLEPQKPQQSHLFKKDYDMSLKKSQTEQPLHPSPPIKLPEEKPEDLGLKRSKSIPATMDPRLDDYIKFYQQEPTRRSSSSTKSHRNTDEPKLASALVNGFESNPYSSNLTNPTTGASTEPSGGKLSSFLRRRSTISGASSSHTQANASLSPESRERRSNSNSPPPCVSDVHLHPGFKELKPLKRVAFHSSTFLIDPPQQIPSRNPRKGNVEVTPDGTVKIKPLSEEEKLAIEHSRMNQGGGLVVGGSFSQSNQGETVEPHPSTTNNEGEEDPKVDKHAKSLGIDKPMISHGVHSYDMPVKKMALDVMYTRCCHLREILPIPAILKQIPKGSTAPITILQLRNPTPTLIEIQTFADFIRIAPIICVSLDGVSLTFEQFKILLSAMSAKRQLEKLSLRNTPINAEGWSLLCWFLSRNKVIGRLDITQCPSLSVNVLKKRKKPKADNAEENRMTCNKENRSDMDWSLLVATLVARGGIEELILTGCCISDLDIFEKLMKLAVSRKTTRLGLAYNQLQPKHLKILVENWLFQDFAAGLDLGYNDFSSSRMNKILIDYSKTPGFDKKLEKSSLAFLSFNSTNMMFTEQFKEVLERILVKLPNLKYLDLSNNQRLFGTLNNRRKSSTDSASTSNSEGYSVESKKSEVASNQSEPTMSSLSEASIISYFTSKLPMFPKLVRLHLENNNFSDDSIFSIARVLPFCKHLGYFSLVGNKMEVSSVSSLVQAVKNSKTLITLDCDIDDFPDFFKEKIGIYTMRNMERLLYKNDKTADEDLSTFDSESLTEQLNIILEMKSTQKLDLKSAEVTKFVERARTIRAELKAAIGELLKLQLKNELNLEGKETLIKFIFIDSSIEKGLQLIDSSLVSDNELNTYGRVVLSCAEDEKGAKIQAKKAASEFAAALPDHELHESGNLEIPNDVHANASPLHNSRSSSRSNLQSLNREEGSVLKLAKLHDYHVSDRHSDFLDSLVDLSGEEIRRKLLSVDFSDLDMIIDTLDKLKKQGITLENVFNMKHNNPNYPLEQEGVDLAEIKKKLEHLSKPEKGADSNETNSEKKSSDDESEESGENKDDTIHQAYDQVLSTLAPTK